MNSAKQIDAMVAEWIRQGKTKAEIIIGAAEAEVGWCYVWGATGQQCTPSGRRTYAARKNCPADESALTLKRCQVTREVSPKANCSGCKWYPEGERTLMDDCQGFVKQISGRVGIKYNGGGCTSMWKDNRNWEAQGDIATLPGQLCCVFWTDDKDPNVKSHIGFYIGGGMMIHCSGEVKKEKLSKKCTDWAIPKGLGGDIPVPTPTHKTIRRGSTGPDVVECQQDLIQLDYDLSPYGANGKFGAKTESAVKAFQRTHTDTDGTPLKVDGIVGQATWRALDAAVGPEPEPGPEPQLYTVTIPHVTEEQAEELISEWPGAEKKPE